MRLREPRKRASVEVSDEQDERRATSHNSSSTIELSTFQDDVECLIHIAAQLFSAIEAQIHVIERDLLSTLDEDLWYVGRNTFKDQLIQSARSLDTSVRQIADHLQTVDRRVSAMKFEPAAAVSMSAH